MRASAAVPRGVLIALAFAGSVSRAGALDCPHWISVTSSLSAGDPVGGVDDMVDLGEKTVVDGVAFSCPVQPEGDPVVDKAAQYAVRFAALKQHVKARSSVRTGILMQATMGHGGEPGSRAPWQLAVHADGKVTYRFCPLDRNFLDYIAKASRTFSDARPDFFMVDDDTRLVWGLPGCFCPLHLAEFAKRTGRPWTREQVVVELKSGTGEYAEKWRELKAESLAAFFRVIRANYDADIPGILCTVTAAEHFRHARAFAQILAAPGQMPVVRGNGAPYHGNELEAVAWHRFSYAAQRRFVGTDVVYLQEADTCPHTRWATSSTRLVNHMVMLALEGIKGAKIWITRSEKDENRSRTAYRRAFQRNRGLMEWAAKVDFRQSGFVIPVVPFGDGTGWDDNWGFRYFSRIGIPCRVGKAAAGDVVALSGGGVDRLSDAALREILAGKVLLDGTAAIRLTERGFGFDIGVTARPWTGRTIQRQVFADGRTQDRGLDAGFADLSDCAAGAEIRSRLYNRPRLSAEYDYVAPGGLVFANACGGRVFTFAGALTAFRPPYYESIMYSETYRDEVMRAGAELLGAWPGGAYYLGDEPMMFEIGETAEGERVFVLDNLELDADDAPEISFAQEPVSIERLQGDGSWRMVPFARRNAGVCSLETVVRTQEPAVFRYSLK